jgi:multidrug efflux pump subunit AcrB
MVPLGTLVKVKESYGPDRVMRYNGYPAAEINGGPAPGVSSGQSEAELKKGPNVIRAAIVNAGGATDFCARFLDEEARPVKGLTVSLASQSGARARPEKSEKSR